MTFMEAMHFILADRVAVRRRAWERGFVWYDKDLFLNRVPFGLRYQRDDKASPSPYSPTEEDLLATDWAPDTGTGETK